jgi:hypothetical protein
MLAVYAKRVKAPSFALKLAKALNAASHTAVIPALSCETGKFLAAPPIKLINWGCSTAAKHAISWAYNHPADIKEMSNKINMFRNLRHAKVPCLAWSTQMNDAFMWLQEGSPVYARHLLTSHSGKGIEVIQPAENPVVPEAPLYTRAVTEPFTEYRAHVVGDRIVCVQQKKKMGKESLEKRGWDHVLDMTEKERQAVRTYRNGWVFCVKGVQLSDLASEVVLEAMAACGGTMGCVDLLVTEAGLPVVIELNTAPALRSKTVLGAYVDAIKEDHPDEF